MKFDKMIDNLMQGLGKDYNFESLKQKYPDVNENFISQAIDEGAKI